VIPRFAQDDREIFFGESFRYCRPRLFLRVTSQIPADGLCNIGQQPKEL
jgi:hypothetical protein